MLRRLFGRRKSKFGTSVTLREIREPGNLRLLTAGLARDGSLDIHGIDSGDEVEQLLGERTYEWRWHIAADQVEKLRTVLGGEQDVLAALAARFSGSEAADLQPFFEEHHIRYKPWSRNGD